MSKQQWRKSDMKTLLLCISLVIVGLAFTCLTEAKVDPKNIVGYWLFDESGKTIVDSSGNKHDGEAVAGAVKHDKGKFGTALVFDGTVEINIPDDKALQLGKNQTIMAWINPSANATDWVRFIGKGQAGPRNYGLWIWTNGEALYQMYAGAGTACNAYLPGDKNTVAPNNEWTHMAGVYDGKEAKLYLNGKVVNKTACSIEPATSNDPLTFGHASMHTFFKGSLDEVAIFNVPLSDADIINFMKGITQALSVSPEGSLASTWGVIKEKD
jgi:hypothetical protein